MDGVPRAPPSGLRDRDRAAAHGLGARGAWCTSLHLVDDAGQRAVATRTREARVPPDRSGGRRRDHLRARALALLADLVHVLRMRRCALGLVARCRLGAAAMCGEALLLFVVTLILEPLGLVFVHVPPPA